MAATRAFITINTTMPIANTTMHAINHVFIPKHPSFSSLSEISTAPLLHQTSHPPPSQSPCPSVHAIYRYPVPDSSYICSHYPSVCVYIPYHAPEAHEPCID